MTDPSRIQTQWKTPFFFNPYEKRSNDLQQYFTSSHATDTSSSARSSPLHSPLPHLPSSPHHHHLRQTNSCASFQPFDPFDTDDSTTLTNKDAELDKLSTLLSRQFLEDVDAETVPSSSSPTITTTTTKTTSSTMSTPNTKMLGSFTHTISSPWAIDDSVSFKQPWSPVLNSNGLLPSPTLTASVAATTTTTTTTAAAAAVRDNNTASNIPAASQWDRFEPYGNDSEFDPTLPFYRGNHHQQSPINIDQHHPVSSITTSTGNNNGISMGQENQQETFNMTTVALQKLSLLFPGHSERELEQTLATLDYDVERTIEVLSPKKSPSVAQSDIPPAPVIAATSISKAPLTVTAEKVHLIKSPSTATTTSTTTTTATATTAATTTAMNKEQHQHQQQVPMVSTGTVRKRQVCRHYLAGECYRKDCWFAHDLEVKPCKFWLQGLCLKGDTCEFAHSLEELEQVAKNHHHHHHHQSSNYNNNSIDNKSTSAHHQLQQEQQQDQYQQQQQQQQYTSPTVADFPILLARSKRKSKKKSHNKKIKT